MKLPFLIVFALLLQEGAFLAFSADSIQIYAYTNDSTNHEVVQRDKRLKRALIKDPNFIWPWFKLYYSYKQGAFNEEQKKLIRSALNLLESVTCMSFLEDSTANNRVEVGALLGCYSYVGRIGGIQTLSLGTGCLYPRQIIHEFLHALGFIHSHMRPDRDQYVKINVGEIQQGKEFNFNKEDPSNITIYSPYDYGSIMHYEARAFSKGSGRTVVPIKPMNLGTIGSRWLSFYDIKSLNSHYKCNRCSPTNTPKCLNGGYQNPLVCGACLCPSGYFGRVCQDRALGDGETLEAKTAYQTKRFSVVPRYSPPYDSIGFTYLWFKGSINRKLEIRIKSITSNYCADGCSDASVEVKLDPDQGLTGQRVCCPSDFSKTFISGRNITPVILHTLYNVRDFELSYRLI